MFVAEGPRVVAAAFEAGAPVEALYVEGTPPIATVARRAGVPVVELPPGAADRIGDTRTPQAVFAVVAKPRVGLDALTAASLVLVGTRLSDPGNVGTLMRSAAAAGATGLGLGPGSVDAYNPKVVRASAGACFAIRTVEGVPAVEILATLGAQGFRRIGAAADRRPRAGRDRPLACRPRSCWGTRRTVSTPDAAARRGRDDPDARRGVAQRRDGRHRAAVRSRPPAPRGVT